MMGPITFILRLLFKARTFIGVFLRRFAATAPFARLELSLKCNLNFQFPFSGFTHTKLAKIHAVENAALATPDGAFRGSTKKAK